MKDEAMQVRRTLKRSPSICLSVIGCVLMVGCDGREGSGVAKSSVDLSTFENLAHGYGAVPFFVEGVSQYQNCRVFLYHDRKADLVLAHELTPSADTICIALPQSPSNGDVIIAWEGGFCRRRLSSAGSFGAAFGKSERFRDVAPVMSLLGTTFGPNPNPDDFTGEMWCFVVQFEGGAKKTRHH